MAVRNFQICIPEAAVVDLKARLSAIRCPEPFDAEYWEDGAGLSFMRHLADHWLHRFDWRLQEELLNRLPN